MTTPWPSATEAARTPHGHLPRVARTVHSVAHVDQGGLTGYVGMSGLATGPHLHHEIQVNGVHQNPQSVPLPGAEPLRAPALMALRQRSARLLAALMPQAVRPPRMPALAQAIAPAAGGGAARPDLPGHVRAPVD